MMDTKFFEELLQDYLAMVDDPTTTAVEQERYAYAALTEAAGLLGVSTLREKRSN